MTSSSQLVSARDIKALGTIMGVWAHPDDDTFTSAGLLLMAAQNGQRVINITATKGELGVQDESRWPAARLDEIRMQEQRDSLEILGVHEQHWLGYHDGSCDKVDAHEAVEKVLALINEHKPDTIITFGPEGHTGHPDHIAAGEWARAACKRLENPPAVYVVADSRERYDGPFRRLDEQFNYYFNLPEPKLVPASTCDIYLKLPKNICNRKLDAIRAQVSQTDRLFKAFKEYELHEAFSLETFVRA